MADIERLPCSVGHELRADAAIIRNWIDMWSGPINREALAERLDRYANAAEAQSAEIEALRAEVEALRKALGRILENEASDWKAAEEFGGYVLDDELREEARAALEQETKA